LAALFSCTWSDEKTSIGTKTAQSTHAASCRLVSSFMLAKVENFFEKDIKVKDNFCFYCPYITKNA